jgi:cytochrome c peroxidase
MPAPALFGNESARRGNGRFRVSALLVLAVLVGLMLAGGGPAGAQPMSRTEARRQAEALAALGQALFADPRLSASGRLACASCHSPDHAFGPPNGRAVQLGGADLRQAGLRAVPSIRYLQAVPQFTEHFFESEDEADGSIDNGPTGGLTWDGRADTGQAQARIPLLSAFEMGNGGPDEAAARALAAGYGPHLAAIYGPDVLNDRAAVFDGLLKAFAYLAGRANLTEKEARGLALFEDPRKGNCAFCHISRRGADGTPPQFTDYGMIALGVPRNREIPANADPAYFDLGLCGPLRSDFRGRSAYCGLFRTPSLRNVAARQVFFHNGVMHSLRDAVAFYASRDADPGRWYPRRADGSVDVFDDLPEPYRGNVNKAPPFGGVPGDRAALDDDEIDAIVGFLQTLTDGWEAGAAGARPAAAGVSAASTAPRQLTRPRD